MKVRASSGLYLVQAFSSSSSSSSTVLILNFSFFLSYLSLHLHSHRLQVYCFTVHCITSIFTWRRFSRSFFPPIILRRAPTLGHRQDSSRSIVIIRFVRLSVICLSSLTCSVQLPRKRVTTATAQLLLRPLPLCWISSPSASPP